MGSDRLDKIHSEKPFERTHERKQEKKELDTNHGDVKTGIKLRHPFSGELREGANLSQRAGPGGHEEAI